MLPQKTITSQGQFKTEKAFTPQHLYPSTTHPQREGQKIASPSLTVGGSYYKTRDEEGFGLTFWIGIYNRGPYFAV